MDLSALTAISSSISAAKEIGTALLDIRDANKMATTVTELNQKIIEAQSALINLQPQFFSLFNELVDANKQLELLRSSLDERNKYKLFELSPGVFCYQLKISSDLTIKDQDPVHYVCQPCLDNDGIKAVLVRGFKGMGEIVHKCPKCEFSYHEGWN